MTPGKARSAPVALAPAMRPCLLACVPSWTFIGRSSTRCQDSTQSPAAKTPSWPGQRWWSSTRSAPLSPSSSPASARERRRRAHARSPSRRGRRAAPRRRRAPAPCVVDGPPASSAPRRTSMPTPSAASCTWAAMSASSVAITWPARSTSVTAQAALHERLGHLEPDVAAADDDRASRRPAPAPRGSARRRRWCAPARPRRRRARRRRDGLGAGGEHELVEALAALVAAAGRARSARGVEVDGRDLGARVDVDPALRDARRASARRADRSRRRGPPTKNGIPHAEKEV